MRNTRIGGHWLVGITAEIPCASHSDVAWIAAVGWPPAIHEYWFFNFWYFPWISARAPLLSWICFERSWKDLSLNGSSLGTLGDGSSGSPMPGSSLNLLYRVTRNKGLTAPLCSRRYATFGRLELRFPGRTLISSSSSSGLLRHVREMNFCPRIVFGFCGTF